MVKTVHLESSPGSVIIYGIEMLGVILFKRKT